MTLQLLNQSSVKVPKKFIEQFVADAVKALRSKQAMNKDKAELELTLVFLDVEPARQLNQQFRGKNYSTDVLSFESLEPASLGELVMCPQVLEEQAAEHDLQFKEEVCYMVLHGLLHLLGYEHENDEKEAERMFQLQDEVFFSILD